MERRLLTLVALFAAAALLTLRVETGKERGAQPRSFPTLPTRAGDWEGRRRAPTREEIDILGADNVEFMHYRNSAGDDVSLCVVREKENRASFHPPEYCYLAQSSVSIVGKGRAPISLYGGKTEASTMTLKRGDDTFLVLYWYRIGSYRTPSYYRHQLSFMRGILQQGGSDSAMVRLSTRVGVEGVEGAMRRLEAFLADLAPHYAAL